MKLDDEVKCDQTKLSSLEEKLLIDRLQLCGQSVSWFTLAPDAFALQQLAKDLLDHQGNTVKNPKSNMSGSDLVY
ncbi:hypothetical protein ILUMI_15743 [Ignelater luminosus]|uniref:Uncharacterized protein n=1 Tax=Ignelater luminosus TaxID=2038154 RepID=A0A8K0G3K5_IGNLU|nr:hypothetical protein ILUMI_15743 [Ignelater luminosus]